MEFGDGGAAVLLEGGCVDVGVAVCVMEFAGEDGCVGHCGPFQSSNVASAW